MSQAAAEAEMAPCRAIVRLFTIAKPLTLALKSQTWDLGLTRNPYVVKHVFAANWNTFEPRKRCLALGLRI